jgi:hypothetical protein
MDAKSKRSRGHGERDRPRTSLVPQVDRSIEQASQPAFRSSSSDREVGDIARSSNQWPLRPERESALSSGYLIGWNKFCCIRSLSGNHRYSA